MVTLIKYITGTITVRGSGSHYRENGVAKVFHTYYFFEYDMTSAVLLRVFIPVVLYRTTVVVLCLSKNVTITCRL